MESNNEDGDDGKSLKSNKMQVNEMECVCCCRIKDDNKIQDETRIFSHSNYLLCQSLVHQHSQDVDT